MVAVDVDISNPVSGFKRSDDDGRGGQVRVPQPAAEPLSPRQSPRRASRRSSATWTSAAASRSSSTWRSTLAGTTESVERGRARGGSARARSDRAHRHRPEPDRKLPLESSSGLNQVITLASPGVVADSNGFFHPIGDHAQTQFSIDNQPVTDQQSRVYSNQISPDAVQSMEVITGVAPAEYGDKSSLVVHIVTKSGLDQPKPTGGASFGYGSFKSPTGECQHRRRLARRRATFCRSRGLRTDRFLDPPEFEALHDRGDSVSFFDRFDAHTERRRHVPPEPAGGAVVIRRAEHVRPERRRQTSTRRSTPSTSRPATRR